MREADNRWLEEVENRIDRLVRAGYLENKFVIAIKDLMRVYVASNGDDSIRKDVEDILYSHELKYWNNRLSGRESI